MRIYVASKYEEKTRVREVMNQLRDVGHEITYDWTTNEQVTPDQAVADMNGVMSADALVLIVEKDLPYRGALVEMGIALGAGIPVYVLGTALDAHLIFLQLPYMVHRGLTTILGMGPTWTK